MCPLNRFEVKMDSASLWIRAHSGITRIGERAGLAIAEASDVVFVAAEGLGLGV